MFIQKINITNYRIFPSKHEFCIDNICVPDNQNNGSGLTIFVGENGLGKTSILDAAALSLLEYKSDQFKIDDLNEISEKVNISTFAYQKFQVKGTMPRGNFDAIGFEFTAGIRQKVSKKYLQGSLVTDHKFIKNDPAGKPDDSSPDLRVAVNNPWAGKRFSENDILYLEKNRVFQTRSGTYNSTRFDRLMQDFNFQYLQKENRINTNPSLDSEFKQKINDEGASESLVENEFLVEAIKKFKDISGSKVSLEFIENQSPFNKAFFAERVRSDKQIKLSEFGSGFEIIFSVILSFYLAKQSGKDLIILIDEPELHLHPKLQKEFVKLLLEISKDSQIILTSHSPLFLKQLFSNDYVGFNILSKSKDQIEVSKPADLKLPYISSDEISFVAFGLESEEYHNQLYEELKNINDPSGGLIKSFDSKFFIGDKNEPKDSPWKGNQNEVSIHTHIRNQIHHRSDLGAPDEKEMKSSIEKMRKYF